MQITVQFDAFYDPDIQDDTLKYDAVNLYEWALTDDSHNGKTHTKWQHIDKYNITSKQVYNYHPMMFFRYINRK